MDWGVKFTLLFAVPLLLISLITEADASWAKYGKILVSENLEDRLSLLSPRSLLMNSNSVFAVYKDNNTAVNYTCGRDIAVLEEALVRRESWALKMLDASSKIPSGLLMGNIVDLGMYDECIGVKGESLGFEIRGRHCMYSISATQGNMNLILVPTLSICVPSTCEPHDVVSLFNSTISTIDKLRDLGITVNNVTCAKVDVKVWDTEFIICFSILMGFIGFLVTCSLCDLIQSNREIHSPALRILGQFSLQRNAAAILSTRVKEGNLPVIHGVRFLSIAWVVLGHQYVVQAAGANINTLDIFEWVQSWKSLYIFIAPFAVDTFFTLSGFLMTYVFLKEIPKRKSFNIPMYYLHRFLRLTPAIIALLVISVVFLPKIGSGARWDMIMEFSVETCRTKWWPFLLYVQNFVDVDNMCLGHLWYLAVDMQLFWISPIILYPLYKKPKVGLAILLILFIASLAVPATVVGIHKYRTISFTHEINITNLIDVFKEVYIMPYNRAAPWLIGVFLGFEVVNNNRRLNKSTIYIGWLLAIGAFAFCTFGTRSFIDPNYKYNPIWETFFTTTSRPFWAFGVCWIIYASIYNFAGPITRILSWKLFVPLSRISYCLYLVHIVFQLVNVAALRNSQYFSDYNTWHSYTSNLGFSLIIAFVFSLLFESPVLVLEKILFRKKRDSRYESQRELRLSDEEENGDGK